MHLNRIVKLVISFCFYCIRFVYKFFQKWIFQRTITSATILYYHQVIESQRIWFAKQMQDIIRWTIPIASNIYKLPNNGKKYVAITFDDAFQNVLKNAIPELIARSIPATIFVSTDYLGKKPDWELYEDNKVDQDMVMSAKEIKSLPQDLISIGSHTKTHSNLVKLPKEKVEEELFESKQALEKICHQKVELFSFPYGENNDDIKRLAFETGYKRLFTIEPKFAFQVPGEKVTGRVRVDPSDWKFEFRLKILGAYNWLSLFASLKAKLTRQPI